MPHKHASVSCGLRQTVMRSAAAICALAVLMLAPAGARGAMVATHWRGVQVHSLWASETDQQMSQDLDYAKATGANVVRLDIGWATLESNGPGQYTAWYANRLAAFMAGASQRGLKVIAILFTTPCWASSAHESLKQGCTGDWWGRGVGWYPPSNDQDFANFARYITSTYGSDLAAVEIGNEPDNPQGAYWTTSDPAGDYARMLRAAYPAAKQGDSSVPVLAASMSGSDLPFMTSLYRDGVKGYYDGISVHPYSDPRPPDFAPPGGNVRWEFAGGLAALHALQAQNGDSTPLWVTELGWSTVNVSPEQQAQYITESYHILAGMPYVQAGVAYELHDDIGGAPSDPNAHYGVMSQGYSPKPAYAALRTIFATPSPPALASPAVGTSVRGPRPVVSYTAQPGATVAVYVDGSAAGSATAGAGGQASVTMTRALGEGTHSSYATQTDPYGNVSQPSAAAGVTVVAAPPSAPKPAIRTSVKLPRLHLRTVVLNRRTAVISCRVTRGAIRRCAVYAFAGSRRVGVGHVRVRAGTRHWVRVHVRLTESAWKLLHGTGRRPQLTFRALAQLADGHRLHGSARLAR